MLQPTLSTRSYPGLTVGRYFPRRSQPRTFPRSRTHRAFGVVEAPVLGRLPDFGESVWNAGPDFAHVGRAAPNRATDAPSRRRQRCP